MANVDADASHSKQTRKQMKRRTVSSLLVGLLVMWLFLIPCLTGCYQTEYSVGPENEASVNKGYVGKFSGRDGDVDFTMVVRNLDDKHYLVRWTSYGVSASWMDGTFVAHTADVRGVTFAHLRPLENDGSISAKHVLVRVALSNDHNTVTLQHLTTKFFDGVNSDVALLTTIVENIGNTSMYDKPLVMTRVKDEEK